MQLEKWINRRIHAGLEIKRLDWIKNHICNRLQAYRGGEDRCRRGRERCLGPDFWPLGSHILAPQFGSGRVQRFACLPDGEQLQVLSQVTSERLKHESAPPKCPVALSGHYLHNGEGAGRGA